MKDHSSNALDALFITFTMRTILKKSNSEDLSRFGVYAFPPIAAIVLLGILSFLSLQNIRHCETSTAQAHLAVATVRSLVRDLVNAETGQRGYLLTGQPNYLEPYHSARGLIHDEVEQLQSITSKLDIGLPFVELEVLIKNRLKELDDSIGLQSAGKEKEARDNVATGVGKATMDKIRQVTTRMESLLKNRIIESDSEAWIAYVNSIAMAAAALALALFAVVWSMLRVDRELQHRKIGERLIRQRSSQLQTLADIIARIVAARDVDSIVGISLNEFRQLVGAREALIQLKASDQVRIERGIIATGIQKPSAEYLACIFQLINLLSKGEASFCKTRANLTANTEITSTHAWSICGDAMDGVLSAPIWDSTRQEIGRIVLMGKFGEEFNDNDVSIASQLAYTVSVALENARLTANANAEAERKDEFLAMLGHELRNPLAGVLTGCEALLMVERSQQAKPLFESIHRQSMLMSNIVDDLLDVSRIGRNKITLNRIQFELLETVKYLVEDYRQTHPTRTITFDTSSIAPPLYILGDKTRIVQSITNLLHNACKFSQEHQPVEVRIALEKKSSDLIRISVTDFGIGLDAHDLEDIFMLFHQSHVTIDRSQGGLGIGLTLAKGLVEMHGGTISAESRGRGHGSTFTITLPLSETIGSSARTATQASKTTSGFPKERKYRILAIDDRMDALLPLRVLITQEGHDFAEAEDGRSGFEKAIAFQPDIVLCDIGLPGDMNGLDVARGLRSHSTLHAVYLVALSGYSQPSDHMKSAEAGFDFHVAKPVNASILRDLIYRQPKFAKRSG